VASSLIPLLVFHVLGRFRLPLMAALIPFAALTLVTLVRWAGRGEYSRAALTMVGILALASWTGRPLEGRALIRAGDWRVPFSTRDELEVQRALAAHDPAAAAVAYLDFFKYEPDVAQLTSPHDRTALLMLGRMHAECAALLREAGQAAAAKAQVDRANVFLGLVLQVDPSNAEAVHLLAEGFFGSRSFEEAAKYYTSYLQHQPNDIDASTNLGVALIATGKLDEAIGAFRRAVELDPVSGVPQRNLANALFDQGDIDEAARHAERAVALRPRDPGAHDVLGRAWAVQGKIAAARAQFEEALRIDPANAEARGDLQKISR
jgi:tetratricopeptide (TPR) repeat protein